MIQDKVIQTLQIWELLFPALFKVVSETETFSWPLLGGMKSGKREVEGVGVWIC